MDGRRSRDILAEELGVSKDKVQRFIRLTFLVPELLRLVDEGHMKMLPAVELSYLSHGEQEQLVDAMEEKKPNQVEQFKIPKRSIERFFGPTATRDEIESRIVRALELLDKAERRRDEMGGA